MEIRTCEQYVLAALAEAQRRIEWLERENGGLKARVAELEAEPSGVERLMMDAERGIAFHNLFSPGSAVGDDGLAVPFEQWCLSSLWQFRVPNGVGKMDVVRRFEPELRAAYEERLAEEEGA